MALPASCTKYRRNNADLNIKYKIFKTVNEMINIFDYLKDMFIKKYHLRE